MVSVHSVQQQQPPPQYITDFNSPMPLMDKSPLAMLEKTCETIGLPDTPAKKASPKTKDSSPSHDGKKKDLETIVTKSPRLNPIPSVDKKMMAGCEPSTSMAASMFPGVNPALMQRCFPFPGAAGMQNPMGGAGPMVGYPGMMNPYMMPPFMPPTSMPPMMMTPHMPNGRPCVQPGCQTCAAYSMAAFMPPDVMAQLNMLAAYSNSPSMNMAAMNSGRHVCTYNGGCGKVFASESEHFAHLKSHVAESASEQQQQQKTASSSASASRNSSPPTEKKTLISPKNGSNNRFHPYVKESRSATPNSNNNNNNGNNHHHNSNMAAAVAAQQAAANNSAALQMQAILMSMGMMPPMGPGGMGVSTSAANSMPPSMGFPGPQFNPAAFQAMFAAQQQQRMH